MISKAWIIQLCLFSISVVGLAQTNLWTNKEVMQLQDKAERIAETEQRLQMLEKASQ